ncbi:MAG: glycoside hydrolase family 5 protein [Candidatus Omnitrophica bacterium]|nr:glycoside hydrolase family 5 protein [Candidatus Omnitrophota bacterium]MBU1808166.1 glycoside hydrolase family 5 protein [Candidatus Omnitrophota bacterium]
MANRMHNKLPFLKTSGTKIVDETGKTVVLRGVALGGWLMMEGYILGGRNLPEKVFRQEFEKTLGKEALEEFTKSFRRSFINEYDFNLIKEWGANCVRLPFNYRLIEYEDRPFSLNEEGLRVLDNAVKWCQDHGLYCILDMHAAPGAQNPDWHSDCVGKPELFTSDANKERYARLWHFLASHYKDVSAVAGYDILNEPVIDIHKEKELKELYLRVTKEIRDIDTRHIIFLEGNIFGQRLDFIGKPEDENTAFSVHAYPITDYVFNFEKDLTYPGRVYNIPWSRKSLDLISLPYRMLADKVNVPLFVGEVGINWRGGHYGELKWTKDLLDVFERYGISWTYWTYKSVATAIHPDGIFRYVKSPEWVNHKGPLTGLETFSSAWPKHKSRMAASWKTENFKRNDQLYALLKKYFEKN